MMEGERKKKAASMCAEALTFPQNKREKKEREKKNRKNRDENTGDDSEGGQAWRERRRLVLG